MSLDPLSEGDYADIRRRQDERMEAAVEALHLLALEKDATFANMVADATHANPAQRALYLATMLAARERMAPAEAYKAAQTANATQVAILYQPEQFKRLHTELIQEVHTLRDGLLIALIPVIKEAVADALRERASLGEP